MTSCKKCLCTWAVVALLCPLSVKGQTGPLYHNLVDTLSVGQRISLRTNAVDWVALTPNFGVELTLGKYNWSKWTLGVYGRMNWKTTTHQVQYNVYDLYEGRLELRKYWHGKSPRRVFYWGVYGGANKFDVKFSRDGERGNAFVGGLTAGTVAQLYGYANGASLDLDLGLSLGVVMAKREKYHRELRGNSYQYVVTEPKSGYELTFSPWVYAASTDVLRVSLVYHFGTSVANRYKRRALVDESYRLRLADEAYRRDSLQHEKERERHEKNIERQRERNLRRYAKAERDKQKTEAKRQKAAMRKNELGDAPGQKQ